MSSRSSGVCIRSVAAFSAVLLGCAGHAVAGTARLVERPDLGVTLIQFEGEIVRGDLERIQALVPAATKANPPNQVFVSLASPGGLVQTGLEIGEYLRQHGIGTLLLEQATCASACTFVFWGGTDGLSQRPRRIALTGTRLGVHRMSLVPGGVQDLTSTEVQAFYEHFQKRVASLMDYHDRMEVNPSVQRRMFDTASRDMYT